MISSEIETKKQKLVIVIITTGVLFALLIYPLLHEAGHLLAANAFGSRHNSIKLGIFQAWALFDGSFSKEQTSIINISGIGFTFILWLIFIVVVPKECAWWLEPLKLVYSSANIASLLVWVVVPILTINGKAPMSEDATKFTISSSYNEYAIAFVSFIVVILSLYLFFKKNNIKKILIQGDY
jgi:hypothetical protein